MADVLNAFVFLRDNVPRWIDDLSSLGKKMAESNHHGVTVLKARNGSTESLRPIDHKEYDIVGVTVTPLSPATTSRQPSQMAKRHRKSISSLSVSESPRSRTRGMVVVHYDSEIQRSFEDLVRNIGVGRNLLRKGKMAARMDALANLTADLDGDDEDDLLSAKIAFRPRAGVPGLRSTRSMGFPRAPATGESENKVFDAVDQTLEKAQGLCERAAHQCLRDGNSQTEINNTKAQFEEVLKLSKQEIEGRKDDDVRREASITIVPPKPSMPMISGMGLEVDDMLGEPLALPPIRLTSRA